MLETGFDRARSVASASSLVPLLFTVSEILERTIKNFATWLRLAAFLSQILAFSFPQQLPPRQLSRDYILPFSNNGVGCVHGGDIGIVPELYGGDWLHSFGLVLMAVGATFMCRVAI